jgi:hypothetical protein
MTLAPPGATELICASDSLAFAESEAQGGATDALRPSVPLRSDIIGTRVTHGCITVTHGCAGCPAALSSPSAAAAVPSDHRSCCQFVAAAPSAVFGLRV